MDPLVTIVAISYNQEKYVIETLNSLKSQTYPNIQLIIADDGSTDNTKQLIKEWIAVNWKDTLFLNHPVNQGVTKNLNSALPYIKGEYYQFIGCEDIMLPNKISMQIELLEKNLQYDIVYSDMLRMDENGTIKEFTHYTKFPLVEPQSGFIYESLIDQCFIATPTALMRIKVLFTIGGDNESLEVNDYDFWLRASKHFQFLYHNEITMKYRIVSTSISNRTGAFVYRNGFLTFYLNYDKRQPYRKKFDRRLVLGIKNLSANKFSKTSLFAFKAFLKTHKSIFIKYFIKGIPLYIKNKINS